MNADPPAPKPSADPPAPKPSEGSEAATVPTLQGPIDIRSLALTGLLLMAALHTLEFARTLLFPVAIALLANVALTPIVRQMARRGVPEGVGAIILLVTGGLLIGAAGSAVVGPASEWQERLPGTISSLEQKLRPVRESIEAMEQAAETVEEAAQIAPEARSVEVRGPTLLGLLLDQTGGFLSSLGLVVVLLFFLLASGENFLRKVVSEIPRLRDKKLAVEVVRQAEGDIARYFLTISVVNFALGVVIGLAMYALGVPNPLLWGVMAGTLNFVPYLGALVGTIVIALVAVVSFDEPARMAAVPAAYYGLTIVEGSFITPYLLGRGMLLSPVAVLGSLMLWTWLWGVAGALVAVPILVAVKVTCERIEDLRPIATLLGR